jgi:hypothetical protein
MIFSEQVSCARNADILALARSLGARLKKPVGSECPGPCPVCGGKDRFSVNIRQQVFNCRKCKKGGDAIALVQFINGSSFAEAVAAINGSAAIDCTPVRKPHRAPERSGTTTADALRLWAEGVDPRGTPAEIYLRSRALDLPDDLAGEVLRWHVRTGAMLALFRSIATGAPQAVSRTFLDPNGEKVERKFLGPVGGAAVMLDPFDEVTHGLHISEGVETGMAARQPNMKPSPLKPTWAIGDANGIAKFPVLAGVESLTILAENGCAANAAAVEACGERWSAAGREVVIVRSTFGKDLNDALQEKGRALSAALNTTPSQSDQAREAVDVQYQQ